MVDAQVAAEDQTFWTNPCIDFRSIVRAALQNFPGRRRPSPAPRPSASSWCASASSTPTCWPTPIALASGRSRRRSWPCGSATLSRRRGQAEAPRDVPEPGLLRQQRLRHLGRGQRATSARTSPPTAPEDQLTIGEAALLAGLVRAPRRLDPTQEAVPTRTLRRRDPGRARHDADADRRAGTSCSTAWSRPASSPRRERDQAAAEQIVLAPPRNQQYQAPHFVYAVRREAAELLGDEDLLDRGGLRINTTLDYDGYQVSAEKWARRRLRPRPPQRRAADRQVRRARRWPGSSSCRAATSTTTRS